MFVLFVFWQVVTAMGVVVRLHRVCRTLVSVLVAVGHAGTCTRGHWMGVLVDVLMSVFVNVLVRVFLPAVSVSMAVAVAMGMRMDMAVHLASGANGHRRSPLSGRQISSSVCHEYGPKA